MACLLNYICGQELYTRFLFENTACMELSVCDKMVVCITSLPSTSLNRMLISPTAIGFNLAQLSSILE